jgi:hypothetical protein
MLLHPLLESLDVLELSRSLVPLRLNSVVDHTAICINCDIKDLVLNRLHPIYDLLAPHLHQ